MVIMMIIIKIMASKKLPIIGRPLLQDEHLIARSCKSAAVGMRDTYTEKLWCLMSLLCRPMMLLHPVILLSSVILLSPVMLLLHKLHQTPKGSFQKENSEYNETAQNEGGGCLTQGMTICNQKNLYLGLFGVSEVYLVEFVFVYLTPT